MFLIGALIQILITGVVFGVILQIAAKLIMKEGIEFVDAFKAAIIATAVIAFADYGLSNLTLAPAWIGILSAVVYLVIWLLALMIVIGLDLTQSFLVACVFTGITWLIRLALAAALGLGKSLSEGGG